MGLFFISCPLDFETELAKEIKSFWFEMIDLDGLPTRAEFPQMEVLHGGIELEIADHLGFQLNFFSKLANRVLLRIAKFEARYYDQFEKAFAKVEFEKYFAAPELKLRSESHKSRLNNDKNIIEAATNVLTKKKIKINNESANSLYIRIDKDRVTLSLDTSGEHLHRRGYATYRGEAPLRETLAAFLIRKLESCAALDKNLTVLDPFAGSGTVLFEAASAHLPNLGRPYSWLQYKNAPKLFKSESWKKNYRWFEGENTPQLLGFDIDEKAIANLENNRLEYQKIFNQAALKLSAQVLDAARIKLQSLQSQSVWVVTNPPYGVRMADENAKEILENLEGQIDGMIVIHPVAWKFRFKTMKLKICEDFSNQGLNLKLSIFQIPQLNLKPDAAPAS